ncbi:MAG: chloride channel protein, partial [Desulfuromusa sp.]|nr:chloride channel protein [Desulfuromusa sp.]
MPLVPKILRGLEQTGFRLLILSVLVGIVAGSGAIFFYFATNSLEHLTLGHFGHFHPPTEGAPESSFTDFIGDLSVPYRWFLFLFPAVGGIFSGWLVYTFAPEAEGHGTDGAIEAYHRKSGIIRGRVPIIKTVASIITIGTGGSAGREGPIAQIGAGFGSFMATKLGLS